ncbi:MAG: TRAP transporter large permease subunit [Thermodesulfobacteriota bacterium]
MPWWIMLIVIIGSLLFLMASGMPIAFNFLIINIVGAFMLWGGGAGLEQVILSIRDTLNSFALLPIPLFILMGELMFHSGVSEHMMEAVDKWLGRMPGRLALMAVFGGTIFSAVCGASVASVAMLGTVLTPEMEKRGYKKPMSLGPILGSGGLAIMIPPSALAVVLGSIAQLSVGKILLAIIGPGILMAILYASYIIGRCTLQPSIAPSYDVPPTPLAEKLKAFAIHVLPLGAIVFLVVGVIFVGVATPSEAAATGAMGCLVLTFAFKKLNSDLIKKATLGTIRITIMMFMIIAGARTFGNILAFTGATKGLVELAVNAPVHPLLVVIIMQLILIAMGCFINVVAMMMITIPIFLPVITAFGFDPIWFAAIILLNMEMAVTTPPFGEALFVMKAVAPKGTTMGDIYLAGLPFLLCDTVAMGLMITFPKISLFIPSLMG